MKLPKSNQNAAAFSALLLVILGVACSEPIPSSLEDPSQTPNGQLVSDAASSLRAELIQADRDFALSVRNGRLEGWLTAFEEAGMVLPADGPVAVGPEAIRDLFSPLFAEPTFDMSWSPSGAEVAASGDLGYTYGVWETSTGTAGVDLVQTEGKYITVWRKWSDGSWRVVADIGNTQPQPIAAE